MPESQFNSPRKTTVMQVSIVVIGKELLLGQVIDTNSSDISHRLDPLGWKVSDIQIVDDDANQIIRAIDRAFESSDVVITTGGLGPTKDDITKQTLCNYFGGELVHDENVLATVKRVISRRGLELNDLTAKQAMVPSSCRIIQNEVGTAPIMWFERDGKVLVTMPGVPFETREMLDRQVIPQLLQRFPSKMNYEHRTVMVVGYSESLLAMKIEGMGKLSPILFASGIFAKARTRKTSYRWRTYRQDSAYKRNQPLSFHALQSAWRKCIVQRRHTGRRDFITRA